MKKFTFDKYILEPYDKYQWVIRKKGDPDLAPQHVKNKRNDQSIIIDNKVVTTAQESSETWYVHGYYTTLKGARDVLSELVARECSSFKELEKWVHELQKIKM